MGAWIEICEVGYDDGSYHKSHPTMGAWIEINLISFFEKTLASHPTMGAWIEITGCS